MIPRLAALALLALGVAAAEPLPVPNPSFEADPIGWTLQPQGGAEGTLTVVANARTGERALRIEKTNGLGYLELVADAPYPTKPGVELESAVHLRLLDREYGSKVYFASWDNDAAGERVGPYIFSAYHHRVPPMTPAGEWVRLPARWTPADGAVTSHLRLIIAGSPVTLLVDDVELLSEPAPLTHPPTATSTEPPFDEAAARANLARRTAQPARAETVAGRVVYRIGDRLYPPMIHQSAFWNPELSRYHRFGERGIHLQTVALQMGPYPAAPASSWHYPDGFDFSKLEANLLRAVGADPDVQVILNVYCRAPRPWTQEHPDQVWTAEDGGRWICDDGMHPSHKGTELDGEKETYTASYGSAAYRALMVEAMTALGDFLRTSDVGRIVVGAHITGGTDGQFFHGSVGNTLDYSAGNREGFEAWLARRPGAPQAAWPAGEDQRKLTDALFLGAAPEQRAVALANEYTMVAPAELVRDLSAALETAVGRPLIGIVYYPDAMHDNASNKWALSELLAGESPIEGVATVMDYGSFRAPGGTGGVNGTWGTPRLHGAAPIVEIDYRTFRSSMAGSWDQHALGATLTAEGFRAQALRDIGAAAARGMGAWFYDMGGYWYDDPSLWPTIAESARIMEWAHRPDAPAPTAEMAVFVDERAGWLISADQYGLLNRLHNQQREPLNLSGVPYDTYLLEDIDDPALPEYKLYLFLSAFSPTPAEAAAIATRARRPGTVVAFMDGFLTAWRRPEARLVYRTLTGADPVALPAGRELVALPAGNDPLLADVRGALAVNGRADGELLTGDPNAPGATILGRFTDGTPSHFILRGEQGAVAFLPGWLHPRLIHNLAREAGIARFGSPGQAIYVGSGVAVAHRTQPGPCIVTFAEPVDLLDLDAETVLARGVTEWSPEVGLLETEVVLYQAAE